MNRQAATSECSRVFKVLYIILEIRVCTRMSGTGPHVKCELNGVEDQAPGDNDACYLGDLGSVFYSKHILKQILAFSSKKVGFYRQRSKITIIRQKAKVRIVILIDIESCRHLIQMIAYLTGAHQQLMTGPRSWLSADQTSRPCCVCTGTEFLWEGAKSHILRAFRTACRSHIGKTTSFKVINGKWKTEAVSVSDIQVERRTTYTFFSHLGN